MAQVKVIKEKLHIGDTWHEVGDVLELSGPPVLNLLGKGRVELVPEPEPAPEDGEKKSKAKH
jgi:hypothetical protein